MGDEPSGDVTHAERRELDALRIRAYGPDGDILDDGDAVARLHELEDRALRERFPPAIVPPPDPAPVGWVELLGGSPTAGAEAPATLTAVRIYTAPSPPRWRSWPVAGAAAAAVLLGAVAWSAAQVPVIDADAVDDAKTAAVADEGRAAEDAVDYERYLDGLRDDVLSLVRDEGVADRMIRDQLKPYGILYGRTVGAGPTVDHEFCMIIADLPQPSITCIPVENAYANPVSVVLPSWYADADSDMFTGLGELVAYTLMPGGNVVAEPADTADSPATRADSPDPTATAVPPPGWQ